MLPQHLIKSRSALREPPHSRAAALAASKTRPQPVHCPLPRHPVLRILTRCHVDCSIWCLWLFDIWSPIVGKKSEINDFWFKKNDFCLICRERNSFNGLSINRPFLFMQLELQRPIG
jgi:hypothetical protein